MKTYKLSHCLNCSTTYMPTGPAAKYCKECAKKIQLEIARKHSMEYKRKLGRKVGVGSGNAQGKGRDHHSFKTGIGIFRQFMKDSCERCGSVKFLCVHHIDRNRRNNDESNLETVCKRCHQIEHECWKAFEGVTTIPKGSTLK